MKIKYDLSEEYRNSQFIATGLKPGQSHIESINPAEMTAEQRALIVKAEKTCGLTFWLTLVTEYEVIPAKKFKTSGFCAFRNHEARFAGIYGKSHVLVSDHIMTIEEIFNVIEKQIALHAAACMEIERQNADFATWEAECKAALQVEAMRKEAVKAQREAQAEAKRQEAMKINWREDGTAICDLLTALFIASELATDSRFASWAKRVDSVEQKHDNGYSFVGEWVAKGTQELAAIPDKPLVFLVASETGSRRFRTTDYRVVILGADGQLKKTEIEADNDDPGWALRIRDDVKSLLS